MIRGPRPGARDRHGSAPDRARRVWNTCRCKAAEILRVDREPLTPMARRRTYTRAPCGPTGPMTPPAETGTPATARPGVDPDVIRR